ncbi:alpha-E domain-containing protein [Thalassospira sp. MCCC 1A01428]|uniref:alpha-E domain-containing protein n=1 Tax=unclassified Thalassospira TaxID=2648997 RepID=UPI000A1D6005|nr:alpha-E domain-containing protein [Thalassospira sp. MCCC 1A01428]OSQ45895.1 A alpha-helical domain with a conserved ER moti [Thalassospira sp. MCCC 1A01428]
MLSRTAENLFWLSRYVERAENMARLLEMGYRMALMPAAGDGNRSEWRSVLSAAGCAEGFDSANTDTTELTQATVSDYLIFNRDNPSSIINCFEYARANARAMRTAITQEMWEALNGALMELRRTAMRNLAKTDLPGFIDWVKSQGALFRGATDSTILRNDGYDFIRLGTFLERADNTARLLDVKYYVLLPETSMVGDGVDNYQWTTVLRAASSMRAFHWVYRDDYSPWRIAHFLILNPFSPRSLAHCVENITSHLERLARQYGQRQAVHSLAVDTYAILTQGDMDEIFSHGLHEFLSDCLRRYQALSSAIAETYYFGGQ